MRHRLGAGRRRGVPAAVLIVLAATLVAVGRPGEAAAVGACPAYGSGVSRGTVAAAGLEEASGLVAGRTNPGILWAHGDSGDAARLYALDADDASLVASFDLTGTTNTDWEDLAVGPGPTPGENYLYVGDIGDNSTNRSELVVYRVPEPVVDAAAGPGPHPLAGAVGLPFSYPDGAHDAETLMADPLTGDLFIVTKAFGPTAVFRHPAPQGTASTVLEEVAALDFSAPPLSGWLVTGGDISQSGDEVLVRTYLSAFVWRRGAGASVAEALGSTPCPVPVQAEPQGEAIGYAADGRSYFTLSERSGQGPRPLYRYACPHGLSDVPDWAHHALCWLVTNGHASGYPDATFRPDWSITRAQVARLLWGIAGRPAPGVGCGGLTDVPAWASDGICWLVNAGHASGYADATFRPNWSITRAQVANIVWGIHASG